MQSLNRDLAWRGPGSDKVTRGGSIKSLQQHQTLMSGSVRASMSS
jgi:hypothetical protein